MPVVISEFEAVTDTPPARKSGSDPAAEPSSHTPIEPGAIAPALRVMSARALRSWAH